MRPLTQGPKRRRIGALLVILLVPAGVAGTRGRVGGETRHPAPAPVAIVNWPADYGDGIDPWRRHRALSTPRRQSFVYEGRIESPFWGEGGPRDGSFGGFHDSLGYAKINIVYDAVHHIAFYQEGCCTSFSSVLTDAPAPQQGIVQRDLSNVHTTLGIGLGDSPARVRALLGNAAMYPVRGHPDVEELSYVTIRHGVCGTRANFFFQRGRATRIELVDAC